MRWLDRDMVAGPYLALVMNEQEFRRALRHLKVPRDRWPAWLAEDAQGCVHTFQSPTGGLACVVAFRHPKDGKPIEVACVLVHEAVHVFQQWCTHYEERSPSREFEAYSIEAISRNLMQAYAKSLAA